MSSNLKIAICDDDRSTLKQISNYLKQLSETDRISIEEFYYLSAEETVHSLPADTSLLLLDIGMKGSRFTGMDAAKKLRADGNNVPIIFITSMTDYAIEGYSVHAFAFLPKPIIYSDLRNVILDFIKKSNKAESRLFTLSKGTETYTLSLSDLAYVEVFRHQVSFIMADNTRKTLTMSIEEVDNQLASYGFFRCHRSYLINMHYVKAINTDSVTLTNDKTLPLSKHRRKDFLEKYANFVEVSF